jgi:DNA-binding transcriptional LysR family regulator
MPPIWPSDAEVTPADNLERIDKLKQLYAQGTHIASTIGMTALMNLNRLAYFSAVAEAGSFTQAAQRLGITKAVVSQQVAKLEREVGATLFIRTTRSLRLTEAGRRLQSRCLMILQEAEFAYKELELSAAEPVGTLRLTAPIDYGSAVIVPVAAEFRRRYPACTVQLDLSDQRYDLQSGEWDMAIRIGWLGDSSLQVRKITQFKQYLACGRGLASKVAAISTPEQAGELPFIANSALNEPLTWRVSDASGTEREIRMRSVMTIDSTPAILIAVRENAGIAVLPDFLAEAEMASGTLVPVLPEWSLPDAGIYALYPATRFRPSRVAAFTEMLVEAGRRV